MASLLLSRSAYRGSSI